MIISGSDYEDIEGIPVKLKHANLYETITYDNNINDKHKPSQVSVLKTKSTILNISIYQTYSSKLTYLYITLFVVCDLISLNKFLSMLLETNSFVFFLFLVLHNNPITKNISTMKHIIIQIDFHNLNVGIILSFNTI